MPIDTIPSYAVVADAVVTHLNDPVHIWSNLFKASRKYIWDPTAQELSELRVVVDYEDTQWQRVNRANLEKVLNIGITFRKKLEQPKGPDPDTQFIAVVDALAAIVETVATWFAANTSKPGVRMIGDTNAWVNTITILPYAPKNLDTLEFLSMINLQVVGVHRTFNTGNP